MVYKYINRDIIMGISGSSQCRHEWAIVDVKRIFLPEYERGRGLLEDYIQKEMVCVICGENVWDRQPTETTWQEDFIAKAEQNALNSNKINFTKETEQFEKIMEKSSLSEIKIKHPNGAVTTITVKELEWAYLELDDIKSRWWYKLFAYLNL